MEVATEETPLIASSSSNNNRNDNNEYWYNNNDNDKRISLYNFLEAKTIAGKYYELFMIYLIIFNVIAFIIGTIFVKEYNNVDELWIQCNATCDYILFGNYNGISFLEMESTSILEIVTVLIFTIDYLLRLYIADMENPNIYSGIIGRIRWIPTFFSIIDLISIIPFYIDIFISYDIVSSSFLRMFRLFRMMRVEGRYDTALTMIDDVIMQQKHILFTAMFVGITIWVGISSLYYLVERKNINMIYCEDNECSTDDCIIDEWGIVICEHCNNNTYCYNMYESIPMSSYYTLLNLFGEYPHINEHNNYGKIVGTITAVIAVAVFALPAGIIGNGLESVIEQKRQNDLQLLRQQQQQQINNNNNNVNNDDTEHTNGSLIEDDMNVTIGFRAVENNNYRGYLYNLLHAQTTQYAQSLDHFINILIIGTALTYVFDTLLDLPNGIHIFFDCFELISVIIFTIEYIVRVYAVKEDPKYSNSNIGRIKYMCTFLAIVDILSFIPYWIEVFITKQVITNTSDSNSTYSNVVKSLRLLRILRFEKYTHAFVTFDDIYVRNKDILAVTAFTAILFWILLSTCLYYSERNSLDVEMSSNYNTIPNSMWITLLNLSGESPLSQYTIYGKFITAILGLFATGVFGIPIGVLGAGFEAIVQEENQDNTQELERTDRRLIPSTELGMTTEQWAYNFVNGLGSIWSQRFEILIYVFIMLSVAVGAWQTVEGHEKDFELIETITIVFFTIEYLIRFVGVGADPEFANVVDDDNTSSSVSSMAFISRIRFVASFYSIIDLMAIVPGYIAICLPNSSVNDYDEYLRMLRILRLVKLDKYFPSITLIDDVIRLKYNTLRVAFYAAMTLWILFAAVLFLCEHKDYENEIDPTPLYGCYENCTMADRFQNFFDSMVYTGVHLTGDYPIVTYSWPARFANFFMVIAAVGVVSIPSGLIASGFVQIVQSKNRKRRGENVMLGDDWYEIKYRELEGTEAPLSPFGTRMDYWQNSVNEFLNGKLMSNGKHEFTTRGYCGRVFIFTVIIANVVAVLLESVPWIDKAVGNEKGNFFDRFEAFSVFVFATEYILRLFSAPKNREALYSTFVYATTFFGIVDFLSTAPWFIEQALLLSGMLDASGDNAKIFRIFRIFRILQLEDFVTAFSKLDNVFRASKDVLKATGLMAIIVWIGCGALFFIFEENNPNWRSCSDDIPLHTEAGTGCYDFISTAACNEMYPNQCEQNAFTSMPDALYYTAVFLGGEWGVVDFTWPGRFVCLFLCVIGIGLYSIPIGTLFDSFGAVLGMVETDDE